MIGARTITSLALLAAAIALGAWLGVVSPERLRGLDATAVFWSAVFASLAGTIVFRFLRLHERSAYYFRYSSDEHQWEDETHFAGSGRRQIVTGDNLGDAFDLSPVLRHAIVVALAFLVGLVTFDRRTIDLVASFPRRIAAVGTDTCPAPGETATEARVDPGCFLLRRAFELGYAEDLGPCEPPEAESAEEICTLRQRDEPYLHYAWRLLNDAYAGLRQGARPEAFEQLRDRFERKAGHLESLFDAQRVVVGTEPRASHHLWTNLPAPESWVSEATGGLLGSGRCQDRFRRMPHRPRLREGDAANAGRVLDHVVGQLLFDTRYDAPVGSCRELTIHWDAPPDLCARLAGAPDETLADSGALRPVRSVLERYALAIEVDTLRAESEDPGLAEAAAARVTSLRATPPQRFISFHCYVEEDRTDVSRSSSTLSLDGRAFSIDEIRVPATVPGRTVQVDRYSQVASLLVRGFSYSGLLSNASPAAGAEESSEGLFAGRQGYLAKLEYLDDMDIFLGHDWLLGREDLLAVYPYHSHLQNFVDVFRRRYRRERGRL